MEGKEKYPCKTDILNNFPGAWLAEIYNIRLNNEDKQIYKMKCDDDCYILRIIRSHDPKNIEQDEKKYKSLMECANQCEHIAKPIERKQIISEDAKETIVETLFEYSEMNLATIKLKNDQILEYIVNITEAMIILYKNGGFHSDLRPENIILKNGKIKVLDFGVSIIKEYGVNDFRGYVYCSPEILSCVNYIYEKVDVYSWGVILYQN